MGILGYISEIARAGSIPRLIERGDEIYLHWILDGHTSAYKICLVHKKEYGPIAYKNVHRRIKKLFNANLIEDVKIEGGFKHGARNYKLTTRGLLCIFGELLIPRNINNILLMYPDNTLFAAFLYPYFEKRTIKSATYSLIRMIESYLEECCQITRYSLEMLVEYSDDDEEIIEPNEIGTYPPLKVLYLQLIWHIKSFLLRVTIMKEEHTDWRHIRPPLPVPPELRFPTEGKIRCTADDGMQTYELLSRDQKFMHAIRDIESDFYKGYQKLQKLRR
jgi:hypothetical protein